MGAAGPLPQAGTAPAPTRWTTYPVGAGEVDGAVQVTVSEELLFAGTVTAVGASNVPVATVSALAPVDDQYAAAGTTAHINRTRVPSSVAWARKADAHRGPGGPGCPAGRRPVE